MTDDTMSDDIIKVQLAIDKLQDYFVNDGRDISKIYPFNNAFQRIKEALASRTATGDGALRGSLTGQTFIHCPKCGVAHDTEGHDNEPSWCCDYCRFNLGPLISATPTHDAVRDAALEDAAKSFEKIETRFAKYGQYEVADKLRALKSPSVEKKS